jgi:hypothetical protein
LSKTKFVQFGNQGLWAYDVALGIYLKYLIDAAETSDQIRELWLSRTVSSWREVACIQGYGLTLDADWSVLQRQTFLALAGEACSALASRVSIPAEEIVSWPLLDEMPIHPRGATEVLTAPVIELGHAIIELVSGQLPQAPDGRMWFYGTPVDRRAI